MPRHFGIPRPPEQDVEVSVIAGLIASAVVFVVITILAAVWGNL